MEVVGAGLGHHVDHAARGAPEFRRESAGQYAVFLDGVHGNGLADAGAEFIVIRHAVEHDVGAGRPHAVDGVTDASAIRVRWRDVGYRRYQSVWIAIQGWQFHYLLRADGGADGLRFGVHLHGAGSHFHGGAGGADLEVGVRPDSGADRHRHSLFEGREAGHGDRDFIVARLQVGNHVQASGIAGRGTRNPRSHVLRRYVRVRNDGPGCVEDRAGDLSGLGLCVETYRQQSQNQKRKATFQRENISHDYTTSSDVG